MGPRLAALALASGLVGCRGVPVNVATPKPLEVDVTLRVDIYQHEGSTAPGNAPGTPGKPGPATDTSQQETRRRGRMAQIQSFKNSRLVGEDHTGRLQVIERPSGAYGTFLEQTVAAENADRDTLMRAEAARRRVPLATVETERAQQWRERAFPGEWIELRQANGTWKWMQKSPPSGTPRVSTDTPQATP
jgi:uncharacterized protein YdbL (DUF1318 family)